jgi:hypothetical protein
MDPATELTQPLPAVGHGTFNQITDSQLPRSRSASNTRPWCNAVGRRIRSYYRRDLRQHKVHFLLHFSSISIMAFLSPAAIFLTRSAESLLFPCSIMVAARYILSHHFDIYIATPVLVAATPILLLLAAYIRYSLAQIQQRRRAAALGARVAPKLVGKWPGNLDQLIALVNNIHNEYLGELCLPPWRMPADCIVMQVICRGSGSKTTVQPTI